MTRYRLFLLAHGRSGDKGDTVNIGVIARREEWFPLIERELTRARVRDFLQPLGIGPVERFELPNLGALNFLVRSALGGGGAVALKLDAQGKTFCQALLRMPLSLPDDVVNAVHDHWDGRVPADCVVSEGD
ncbi:MAG: hypothetical protein PVF19_13400 [Gemmatimonadota bacterium]|jgi:hypothetical protein